MVRDGEDFDFRVEQLDIRLWVGPDGQVRLTSVFTPEMLLSKGDTTSQGGL
jgi:hypothetical protein